MQIERYNTIGEILAGLEGDSKGGSSSRKERDDMEWDLRAGYDGAVKLLTEGWPEGVGMVSDLLNEIETIPAKGDVMVLEPDYTGPVFDLSEHMMGNPECHYEVGYVVGPGQKYLDLYFPLQIASGIDARVVAARATASVALVDAIESAGIRCRVSGMSVNKVAYHYTDVAENIYATIIGIKDYDEQLHLPDAAYMLGHPAFKRRVIFALWERSELPNAVKASDLLYGNPQDPKRWLPYLNLDEDAICFPKLELRNQSQDPETHLFTLLMALPEDVRDLIDLRKGASC